MRSHKNQSVREIKMNVGGASLILIMLVFALSVFALLAVRSSGSELRLAEKTAEATREYYRADSEAVKLLQKMDRWIRESYQNESWNLDYINEKLEAVEEVTLVETEGDQLISISYEVPVSEKSYIQVKLTAIEPNNTMNEDSQISKNNPIIKPNQPANMAKVPKAIDRYYQITAWRFITDDTGEYELEILD